VCNVFRRAERRSSLEAHRLGAVVAVVGEWISERVPSMVMRRYIDLLSECAAGEVWEEDLVEISDAWGREGCDNVVV
jgi:hypothetical protein